MNDNEMKTEDPLVSWVMSRVEEWRNYRDLNYKDRWDEYYRLWAGIHTEKDKNRQSERSKLVSPLLAQAVDSTASELEEATFGRKRWVDIEDDWAARNQQGAVGANRMVKLLLEEFELNGVAKAVSEVYLNGCIFGTGIAKIVVDKAQYRKARVDITEDGDRELSSTPAIRPKVRLVPIDPREFVIDSMARDVDEALGMAHEMLVPKHTIASKQGQGVYNKGEIGSAKDEEFMIGTAEIKPENMAYYTKITEYHGLVPAKLLGKGDEPEYDPLEEEVVPDVEQYLDEDEELIEAIVTIANDGFLLKACENPNFMKDRNIIAYQHDTVPNRFYGRGVCQKGYSPQKAHDAELRGRMDALAYSVAPMMVVNTENIPRQLATQFEVAPGRNFFVSGMPNETIAPLQFSPPPLHSFTQSHDLERFVEMGTGAMQSATPQNINMKNSTASGMSMIQSSFVKRSKKTLQNIERAFLDPLVRKCFWRYMQVDPERWPVRDFRFVVHGSMGLVARELEQQQIAGMLNTVPADSPAFWILLRSLYENSALYDKDKVLPIIEKQLQEAMQPKPDARDMLAQKQAQRIDFEMQMESNKTGLEAERTISDALMKRSKAVDNLATAQEKGNKSIRDEILLLETLTNARQGQAGNGGSNQPV